MWPPRGRSPSTSLPLSFSICSDQSTRLGAGDVAPGPFPRTLCFVLWQNVRCKVHRANLEKGTEIQGCSPPFPVAMLLLLGHGLSLIAPMNPESPPFPPGSSTGSTGWLKMQNVLGWTTSLLVVGKILFRKVRGRHLNPMGQKWWEVDLGSPGMGGTARHGAGEEAPPGELTKGSKGLVKC